MDTEPDNENTFEQPASEPMDQQPERGADRQEQEYNDEPTQVPVSAVQHERKKRQQTEREKMMLQVELDYLRKQTTQQAEPQEEDYTLDEPVTRKEDQQSWQSREQELVRKLEERIWSRENHEKKKFVDENLQEFLQTKPNLQSAIADSPNRYEEAYKLMVALSPHKPQSMQARERAPVAQSPQSVPKTSAASSGFNLMNLNDKEFNEWRRSQRSR